jgi:hypothetical protein
MMSEIIIPSSVEVKDRKLIEYTLQHARLKGNTLDAGDHVSAVTILAQSVSDGYHTMDELYEHRNLLFISLLNKAESINQLFFSWKSKLHRDGTMYDGWFIAGMAHAESFRDNLFTKLVETDKYRVWFNPDTEISYHLPIALWDSLDNITEMDFAPEFTGYTPADVLERLRKYYL